MTVNNTTKKYLVPMVLGLVLVAAGVVAISPMDYAKSIHLRTANSGSIADGSIQSVDLQADSIDWTEIVDNMILDTTTSIDMDTNNADLNFDSDTLVIESNKDLVGIGTASPAQALDVEGSAAVSGTFEASKVVSSENIEAVKNLNAGENLEVANNGKIGNNLKVKNKVITGEDPTSYGDGLINKTGAGSFVINKSNTDPFVLNNTQGGIFLVNNTGGEPFKVNLSNETGSDFVVDGSTLEVQSDKNSVTVNGTGGLKVGSKDFGMKRILNGSKTVNDLSISTSATITVPVDGAKVGDFATCSLTESPAGLVITNTKVSTDGQVDLTLLESLSLATPDVTARCVVIGS